MHLSTAPRPLGSHLLPSRQRCAAQKRWRSARVWPAGWGRLGDRPAATRRGDRRRTGDPRAGARPAATRRRGTAPGATARAPRRGRPRALGRPRTSAGARGGLPYPPEHAHIVHHLGAVPWDGSFAGYKKIAFLAVRLCRHSGSGFSASEECRVLWAGFGCKCGAACAGPRAQQREGPRAGGRAGPLGGAGRRAAATRRCRARRRRTRPPTATRAAAPSTAPVRAPVPVAMPFN